MLDRIPNEDGFVGRKTIVSALVITGASGFIGHALRGTLPAIFSETRILVHRNPVPNSAANHGVIQIKGDLLDSTTLEGLVVPLSTVVHLAYLPSARPLEDNVTAARNLVVACREAGIRRMVYCSSAVVVGSAPDDVISEETACRPHTEYERAKYRVEQELNDGAAGRFELAILRPTAVFGPEGRNLVSLADRILFRSETVNYIYSSLQGGRKMHLTSVRNVASALGFLATTDRAIDNQTYIMSEDDEPRNNFQDVEHLLRREFRRVRGEDVMTMPPFLLSALLKLKGLSDTNPNRVYSGEKLRCAGFVRPLAFDAALREFATWFLAKYSSRPKNNGAGS